MKANTLKWLEFAEADLLNCKLISDERLLTGIAAFHAQQIVEKSMKAVLEETDVPIPRIHNLQRLYGMVKPLMDLEINFDDLVILDSVYTNSRYPIGLGALPSGKPTPEESKHLIDVAESIFEQVKINLKESK